MNPMLVPGVNRKPVQDSLYLMRRIVQLVAREYGIVPTDITTSRSRVRKIVEPKQLAMKLIRDLEPEATLVSIGQFFNHMEHTSVMYSINAMTNLLGYNEAVQERAKRVREQL